MARHLPKDALGSLMGVPMSSGVYLTKVLVSQTKPFEATLTAKIPHRDSESFTVTGSDQAASGASVAPESAEGSVGSASAVSIAAEVVAAMPQGLPDTATSPGSAESAAGAQAAWEVNAGDRDAPSPSVAVGRPRVEVSKEAVSKSSFETLGLALRYPTTRIYVRSELLAPGTADRNDPDGSFDSAEIPELYPNLVKLEDARTRKSASDDMEGQFEVNRLRQQLESAVSGRGGVRILESVLPGMGEDHCGKVCKNSCRRLARDNSSIEIGSMSFVPCVLCVSLRKKVLVSMATGVGK